MSDKLHRPESFEFALDFLGDPEASELRAYIEQLEARAADLLEQRHPAPPAAGEVGQAALVRRMCEIILGNTFGNEELESLALLVGHHPDVLNASTVPVSAPLPPVEGEVAELVEWLRDRAESTSLAHAARRITRAADLLEQRHPAPVPVAERLPGPEDCDGEGRCYAWDWLASDWRMVPAEWVQTKPDYNWWLPAHALPLPQGEVE